MAVIVIPITTVTGFPVTKKEGRIIAAPFLVC